MRNKLLILSISLAFTTGAFAQKLSSFKDKRNNKTYKTVQIGDQVWMAENLAFKADSGCFVYQDNAEYLPTYGYLYTWNAAQNVCPSGWHLPNENDWQILETFLGMKEEFINNIGFRGGMVGGKMKESGTAHWTSPNEGANNESGFKALPGGYKTIEGDYFDLGNIGIWWTSTEQEAPVSDFEEAPETPEIYAGYRGLEYDYHSVAKNCMDKRNCISVRCIKD